MRYIEIACLGFIIAAILVPKLKWLLKINRRIKPFDCPLCLSFWLSLCYARLFTFNQPTLYDWVSSILFASAVALTASIIERFLK